MLSPNNLPVQLNSFVGREEEVAEVQRLLSLAHLVTLTGPGGVGKTRLALQVALALPGSFKDGVWLVELAVLRDLDLVVPTLAHVLNVKEIPGQSLLSALTAFCACRQLLLLLDNCEHLLEEIATLVRQLLLNCPDLRVLATSRESLNITGEAIMPVATLKIPDPQNLPALSQLPAYAAIKLFSERALLTQPNFKLTEQNARAVAQICYQLDGLPLALELAVGRLKALSVEQIAARLVQGFDLISQGSRTAPARQQTLDGLISWSYELLNPKEKLLFETLAVFAGDWTLEAAEAVCSDEHIETNEVVDLLSQLVNKSLVIMEERQGVTRYHFLETIKQFDLDKLAKSQKAPAVNRRLLEWAWQLACNAGGQLWAGTVQANWFGALEAEHDNLRAALHWGLTNEPVLAGQLSWELTIFWDAHGYLSEGRRWIKAALQNSSKLPVSLQAQLYFAAGWLAHRQNDFEVAEIFCTESLSLYRQGGDQERVLNVLLNLGWISLCQGHLEQATQRLADCLELARNLENQYCIAASLSYLGLTALLEDQSETALLWCEESVEICRKLGSNHYLGWALTGRGAAALFMGEFEQARAYFLESLVELEKVGERIVGPYNLLGLGVVDLLQEQPERGVRLFGKAEALWEAIGGAIVPVFRPAYEAAVMYASTQLDEATILEIWAAGRKIPLDQILLEYSKNDASLSLKEEISDITLRSRTQELDLPEVANQNKKQEQPPPFSSAHLSPKQGGLTGREIQVLRLLASGLSNAEIGTELALSTLTINTYLRTIYSKLEVSSRNAATRVAFEMGLI